jgi:hypothetical protein
MAVRSYQHHFVRVVMVPVVMLMRMLMLQRFVHARMTVRFSQVKHDAHNHEQTAAAGPTFHGRPSSSTSAWS